MKKIIIYTLILFCFTNCIRLKRTDEIISEKASIKINRFKNSIDKLETDKEVVSFAKSINKKIFGKLQIKPIDTIAKDLHKCEIIKAWNIQNWEKTDLNNDGKTDLLFIAYWPYQYTQYAIIDIGNSNFELVLISSELSYCKLVKPIKIDNKTELLLYDYKTALERIKKDGPMHCIDTLTYKFGSIIERNTTTKQHNNIEYINFNLRFNFSLKIDKQGNANYNCPEKIFMNRLYENNYVGNSNKKIPIEKFDELDQILKYINIKDLQDTYEVDSSDHTTVILTIKFEDGSIKEIRDYGADGSYGLNAVYSKLIKIATETDWK
jgi:hypothetical protein